MRATLGLIGGVVVAALLSSAGAAPAPRRAASSRDGGTTTNIGPDKPGRIRLGPGTATDGGTQGTDARAESLEREVQTLRARVDSLERTVQAQQSQAQQLEQVKQELQAIRAQLSSAEQQRAQAAQSQADRRAQVGQTFDALTAAEQRLAGGNADVDDALGQAEATFTGQARDYVRAARESLRNHDLSQARAYLNAAARAAQSER